LLEPWTFRHVDGVVAVSPAYIDRLRARYPRLEHVPCEVLPFGVSATDFELLDERPQANPFFNRCDGHWHAVYIGAGGDFMGTALRILFQALRQGLASGPRDFDRVRLHFVGTDYAAPGRSRRTVEPLAIQMGVVDRVQEQTDRIPYFQALQLLKDADCLVLIGSDDPAYVASKLHTYVLSGKPILAIVHEHSPMVAVLTEAGAAVVTFSTGSVDIQGASQKLAVAWQSLLSGKARGNNRAPLKGYSARELTERQSDLFNRVQQQHEEAAPALERRNRGRLLIP